MGIWKKHSESLKKSYWKRNKRMFCGRNKRMFCKPKGDNMKITKTASGKKMIKISKSEWETIGKKQGWMKKLAQYDFPSDNTPGVQTMQQQRSAPTAPAPAAPSGTSIDQDLLANGLEEFQKYFINYFTNQPNLAKWIMGISKDPKFSSVTAKLQQFTALMDDIYQETIQIARSN